MANRRIRSFNKRMQQFTEISFFTQKFLRSVNVVVKAEGQRVEYYKKRATGQLTPFYVYGAKSEFLTAFGSLMVGKWKKKYTVGECGFGGRRWELLIKFADGRELKYCGENAYPESFSALDKLLRTDYAI